MLDTSTAQVDHTNVAIARIAARLHLQAASRPDQPRAPAFATNSGLLSAYRGGSVDDALEEALVELADLPPILGTEGLREIGLRLEAYRRAWLYDPDDMSAAHRDHDLQEIALEILSSLDAHDRGKHLAADAQLRPALCRLARIFSSLRP